MVDAKDVELVNDSLERCANQTELFLRFYHRFRDSSEEIAAKFDGTNPKAQARALRLALLALLRAIAGDPEAWQQLELRAIHHDRDHYDIRPEMYAQWRECLMQTVPEFDAEFDKRTEKAWRNVVQEVIDFMVERY